MIYMATGYGPAYSHQSKHVRPYLQSQIVIGSSVVFVCALSLINPTQSVMFPLSGDSLLCLGFAVELGSAGGMPLRTLRGEKLGLWSAAMPSIVDCTGLDSGVWR